MAVVGVLGVVAIYTSLPSPYLEALLYGAAGALLLVQLWFERE